MTKWSQRSLFTKLLVFAVVATLAFVISAGVGAMAALVAQGDLSWPTGERASPEEPSPPGAQRNTPQRQHADADRPQQEKAGAEPEQAASQEKETTYAQRVDELQAKSVETFLDSHERLLRYDAITANDIAEMQANEAALQGFVDQASDLNTPQKYREQYEVLLSAINELHGAGQLAYALAADPTSATQSGFEEYDSHVEKAAALLQRSNETLGRDYKTIKGIQRVSPS